MQTGRQKTSVHTHVIPCCNVTAILQTFSNDMACSHEIVDGGTWSFST